MTDLSKELVTLPRLLSHEVLGRLLAVSLTSMNKYCLNTSGDVDLGRLVHNVLRNIRPGAEFLLTCGSSGKMGAPDKVE